MTLEAISDLKSVLSRHRGLIVLDNVTCDVRSLQDLIYECLGCRMNTIGCDIVATTHDKTLVDGSVFTRGVGVPLFDSRAACVHLALRLIPPR